MEGEGEGVVGGGGEETDGEECVSDPLSWKPTAANIAA